MRRHRPCQPILPAQAAIPPRSRQGLQPKDPLLLRLFFNLIKERIAFFHYEE